MKAFYADVRSKIAQYGILEIFCKTFETLLYQTEIKNHY